MLDQNSRLWMKCLEEICVYLTRSWNHVFVIVKMYASESMWWVSIRFVLHFEHIAFVFWGDPLTFVLERLLSCVEIALTPVFSKT